MYVVELSPRVGMARSLANRAVGEQLVEARVGVRLQDAAEAGQMALGMNALPVGRVREPHGGRFRRTGPSFVAHVDPQPASLRLPLPGASTGIGVSSAWIFEQAIA